MRGEELIVGRFISLVLAAGLLCSGFATWWFNHYHTGAMIESVTDVVAFKNRWQARIDNADLVHPAIIHWLPQGCLCTFLTVNHARDITEQGLNTGYQVYQLESSLGGLGVTIPQQSEPPEKIGSTIVLTDANGQISYLGGYSDGVRCTNSNSLVANFVSSTEDLPFPAMVSLDSHTCVC